LAITSPHAPIFKNNHEKFRQVARYTCATTRAMRSNPMKKLHYDRITTTIERDWLAARITFNEVQAFAVLSEVQQQQEE
jgi:hypothetical protein